MTKTLLAATMLLGVSGTVLAPRRDLRGSAPRPCPVQGVWERVATIQAHKRTEFSGARQLKVVTKKNYLWLEEEARRDTLPLRTTADTARFYAMSGGSGTYNVAGNQYTEHLDLFVDPKFEGKTFTASCRVEGNMWYHSFLSSSLGDTTRAGRDTTTEIWRRVE